MKNVKFKLSFITPKDESARKLDEFCNKLSIKLPQLSYQKEVQINVQAVSISFIITPHYIQLHNQHRLTNWCYQCMHKSGQTHSVSQIAEGWLFLLHNSYLNLPNNKKRLFICFKSCTSDADNNWQKRTKSLQILSNTRKKRKKIERKHSNYSKYVPMCVGEGCHKNGSLRETKNKRRNKIWTQKGIHRFKEMILRMSQKTNK